MRDDAERWSKRLREYAIWIESAEGRAAERMTLRVLQGADEALAEAQSELNKAGLFHRTLEALLGVSRRETMSEKTGIAWCDSTVNFWWGCQEVSPGCDHCYAKTLAAKLRGMSWGPNAPRQRIAGAIALAKRLNRKAVKEGRRLRVFTNSMSDFFDNAVPEAWRDEAWATIRECDNLDWLILTKRPQNLGRFLPLDWGEGWAHVWLGISAENQQEFERRWPHLAAIPAALRWVSAEPLLAMFSTKRYAVDWLVIGGESGAERRDCGLEALLGTKTLASCPVFIKQDSAFKPDQQGRIPDAAFVRQWPRSPASRVASVVGGEEG